MFLFNTYFSQIRQSIKLKKDIWINKYVQWLNIMVRRIDNKVKMCEHKTFNVINCVIQRNSD